MAPQDAQILFDLIIRSPNCHFLEALLSKNKPGGFTTSAHTKPTLTMLSLQTHSWISVTL